MRAIVLYYSALLICLAATANVQASLIVGSSLAEDMGEEEILDLTEESKASSSQTTNSQNSRPFPQLPVQESPYSQLVIYVGMLAAGNGGSMSRSSVPSVGGGNSATAISAVNFSLVDNTLVVWLSRANWLAIPMPPGGSLLRPPQVG
jgi:hypothetical protein